MAAVRVVVLYAYPLGLYSILLCLPLCLQTKRALNTRRAWVLKIVWYLQFLLAINLVISGTLSIPPFITALKQHEDTHLIEAYVVSFAAVALYYAAGLLPDPHGPFRPTLGHAVAWWFSIAIEIANLLIQDFHTRYHSDFSIVLGSLRVLILCCMCILYQGLLNRKPLDETNIEETTSLLSNADANSTSYGSTIKAENNKQREPGWLGYFIGFGILFPYIWPVNSKKHQFILSVSLLLMIAQRIINILVPYQLGILMESIGVGKIPYKQILLYILFRGLQGQQGVLGSSRAILWIPVSQSLFRRLTCAAFSHVLSLSLEFHLSKRIGEVMSALNKGSALNTFLDSFAFQLFPMVFDLGIAAVYFMIFLDAFYSLILIAIMWSYIYMTVYMAKWRAKSRREMALKDREMDAVKMDAMMSYETVHHNGAVPTEGDRFGKQVQTYQKAEFAVLFSLNALNITQNLILTIGILLVVLLSSFQISVGMHDIAMFVSVLAYFTQLQAPLQFFGSFYNQVQNSLIDAERMLDLFKTKPTIVDTESSRELPTCRGGLVFSHVNFSYDGRAPALSDINFTVPPGTSTAIVGESGAGKSTILKLLFRFYDVSDGSICIDGQGIRDLKLASYRQHIGVVPQDTVLFNMSILYNLQYSRPDATEEEIWDACRKASIHDRILGFPEGYNTMVGERGLRLSGGEKQRVAIARAIIKGPQIMLLDEATASLDSHTEKQIQEALETATKGRTTISIAHRLSTIIKSDQILVMHEGRIVERGTHEELLETNGRYADMWEKQTKIKSVGTGDTVEEGR
ncbi:hypothetical protein P154DRAFT_604151 [Amniculicola lignicola CBS 123094]|uniref:Heavy metal tolerance protein n=1 Tax=Amniculicola lignicola CBS 123094 TaxID=1392246 RepID=A0A6A5W8H9_9PLEO|nr:hypothetical protein P154DRAFT_604151 [Amniculicola lignicola CBS 123094]